MPNVSIAKILHKLQESILEEFTLNQSVSGPFSFKKSTLQLQELVDLIFDANNLVTFNHSHLNGHLMATLVNAEGKKRVIDITGILEKNPNLLDITFDLKQMHQFIAWVRAHAQEVKPLSFDPDFYKERERNARMDENALHLAEKIAINIYTTNYYKKMNGFLRGNGVKSVPIWDQLSPEDFQVRVKTVLLTTMMAAHGMNRMSNPKALVQEMQRNKIALNTIRFEENSTISRESSAARHNALDQHKTYTERGFFSTSFGTFDTTTVTENSNAAYTFMLQEPVEHALGKMVAPYSINPEEENEVLFPPGTQFKVLADYTVQSNRFFCMTPTRSVEPEEINQEEAQTETSEMEYDSLGT